MITRLSIRLIRWFCPTAPNPIDALISVVIFSLCAVNTASSQDAWNPATGDWSAAGNWSLGRIPGTADNVVVDNCGTAVVSTLAGTSYKIQNLSIGATTNGSTVEINNGVTLNVATLTIGGGGTLNLDPGASFSQSGGFTNNGNIIINSGFVNTGPIHGTGNGGTTGSIVGSVVDNTILVFNRSNTATFGGTISGTGSIAQSGTGTTILTADSIYTGGTTIASGTVQIGNGGTTGSIVGAVVDNGILAFNRRNTATFSGTISGPGSVVQSCAER